MAFQDFSVFQRKATHPKNTHPDKNCLHKQFAQLFLPASAYFKRKKRGQFVQTVPKLFAQIVLSFGWMVFWGGSPLHEYCQNQGRKKKQ